jgi:hypothetical protein
MAPLVRLLLVFAVVSVGALIAGFLAAPSVEPIELADEVEATPSPTLIRPAAAALVALPVVEPEIGWWWNPDEPGRGFLIDRSGERVTVGTLAYEADGRASWYMSSGTIHCGSEFSGSLVAYGGGQTLNGRFRKASMSREAGRIAIRFLSTTQATLTLPGGRAIPLERYRLDGTGEAGFEPEPGWWWNPAEPGRGFAVEVRNGTVLLTAAAYDERGNPVWYVSHGPLATDRSYRGRWLRLAGGMTMQGGYRVPADTADAGAVALRFIDARQATLTLPDGRSLPISRFDLAEVSGPLALTATVVEVPSAGACGSPIRVASMPG